MAWDPRGWNPGIARTTLPHPHCSIPSPSGAWPGSPEQARGWDPGSELQPPDIWLQDVGPLPESRAEGQECANWASRALLAHRTPVDFERGPGWGGAAAWGRARPWGVSRRHLPATAALAADTGRHHEAVSPALGPAAAGDSPRPRPPACSRYAHTLPFCPPSVCPSARCSQTWGRTSLGSASVHPSGHL